MKALLTQVFLAVFLPTIALCDVIVGVCKEAQFDGRSCNRFWPVANDFISSNSLQALDKEDALIFFGAGLMMWVIGLKLGVLIATMKKAR